MKRTRWVLLACAAAALAALPAFAGCVEGGVGKVGVRFDPVSGKVTEASIYTTRDTVIDSLVVDLAAGRVELRGYTGNGSNLGQLQLQLLLAQTVLVNNALGLVPGPNRPGSAAIPAMQPLAATTRPERSP